MIEIKRDKNYNIDIKDIKFTDEFITKSCKEYSNKFLEEFISKSQEHLYIDGIVSCPYIEGNTIKDVLILVPKNELINTI